MSKQQLLPVQIGSGRRFTVDQQETMGYPLCSLGRSAGDGENETEQLIKFDSIGWQIRPPSGVDRAGSSTLYDGYFGLMWLFKEAGYPDDGEVWFKQYNLLQTIGWVSNGRNTSGGKLTKPSGRHYNQLRDVCMTLMRTAYVREDESRKQGFNVLSFYDLQADQPGPRCAESDALRSHVVFNKAFVDRVKNGGPMVPMDLDLYLSLSTGAPRIMFRTLSWMQYNRMEALPLKAFFDRIGSVQRNYVPAVARKMFQAAHDELVARQVLLHEPTYEKVNGEWYISYPFADSKKARNEIDVLVREACTYGVSQSVAQQLAVSHRTTFADVMAGAAMGAFNDARTVAGSIVAHTQKGWTIPVRKATGEQPSLLTSPLEAYQGYLAAERARRIQEEQVDVAAIRENVARCYVNERNYEAPEWFVEGMTRIYLNEQFALPSLDWFTERFKNGMFQDRLLR
jgi:hypothetical protein